VISLIQPENKVSTRVAERLGETLEGMSTLFGLEHCVYGIDRRRRSALSASGVAVRAARSPARTEGDF